LRVLHFFKTYHPDTYGGIQSVIHSLAEGCAEYGVKSEVLYLSSRGAARNEIIQNHIVHRSKLDMYVASTGFSYSVIGDFNDLAAEVDIVHYHFPWPMMDLAHLFTKHGKPSVISYHSDIIKQKNLLWLYEPLMNSFFSKVDRIVASSPNYVESSRVLRNFEHKVSVIPYGIEDNASQVCSARVNHWRAICGEGFFLFVGMLRYYKGLLYLLEAAKISKLKVVIAGDGADEQAIKSYAHDLGLTNVLFVGRVSDADKSALLNLCRAFVFPSHLRSESFGISLLEAAMFSKPMITCEIGTGTTYVNIDGETGIVVQPENSCEIAAAMSQLSDKETAARYGTAARKRYELMFRQRAMCKSYTALYKKMLRH